MLVCVLAACYQGVDVVYLLDASSSVGEANFQLALNFVTASILDLNIDQDSRVALVTFADNATVRFYLSDYSSTSMLLNDISAFYTSVT